MCAFYDVDEDHWIFPRSQFFGLPTLKHTLPKRTTLLRASVVDEKPLHPKLQIQNIFSALQPLGSKGGYKGSLQYIPNSVLEEVIVEDTLKRQGLEERCRRRTKLRVVRFGESILAVHPSGQGGRRLCFSQLLPWFETSPPAGDNEGHEHTSMDYPELQNIPQDFVDFGCGISPIREIVKEDRFQRLLAINDEIVNLFDISDGYEDPSWLGKTTGSKYSSSLVSSSSLSRELIVSLDEMGRIWKNDLVSGSDSYLKLDHNDYRIIDTVAGWEDKFLASTMRTLNMVDVKTPSKPICLFQTIENIKFHKILSENIIALSTSAELFFLDRRMPGGCLLAWNNFDAFGDLSIDTIDSVLVDEKQWISMANYSTGSNWLAPLNEVNGLLHSYQIPNRLPFPRTACDEYQIIGSDILVQDGVMFCCQLGNSHHLQYVKSLSSGLPTCTVEMAWDPAATTNDYFFEDAAPSASMPSTPFKSIIPKNGAKYDYSFVHSWLWNLVELDDADTKLCSADHSSALLGSIVTQGIKRYLETEPDTSSISDTTNISGPANILLSRW
jgi:hypothetical protein